jgi:hypothetical protein
MTAYQANAIKELFFEVGARVTLKDQAAMAAAIWEIVNESSANTWDLDTGDFQMGSFAPDTKERAELWLGSLNGTWNSGNRDLYALVRVDENGQDWTTALVITERPPVPEPLTMFGVLVGLSSLGMYVRRRTRKPVAA